MVNKAHQGTPAHEEPRDKFGRKVERAAGVLRDTEVAAPKVFYQMPQRARTAAVGLDYLQPRIRRQKVAYHRSATRDHKAQPRARICGADILEQVLFHQAVASRGRAGRK